MEYKRLGNSGMKVSRIILGCMGFGDPSRGTHEWAIGIDEARPIIQQALEAGITTFDTANVYSLGASEEIVGQVLFELTRRDDVILATKVYSRMGSGPKDAGLSRAAIYSQVEQSLKRLKTDYIDLYQIHRYDPDTPIEETLEALHDLVKSGKVRYIGASSMYAWQFAQAQYVADLHGWTRFVSMQDQYNLLMREEEREMLPFCHNQGIGVIPWSPLARGLLTREWNSRTKRSETDRFTNSLYSQAEEANHQIVEAVQAIAEAHNVPMAQIALAWLLHKEAVTAPIVGATRPQHLTDAIAALDVKLSGEEIQRLEAPYVPQLPVAF
ncbi:MAG TPA: aldo/keto reductase [Ktedonobacteraceae bacterium]|nr:aldo/keto reductase [Ktedonobacteraceae bacterium]